MELDFPFHILRGQVAQSTSNDSYVEQLIEQVLFTRMGERVNRPMFGCSIEALIFEPDGSALVAATQQLVMGELQRNLSDVIQVQSVNVNAVGAELEIQVNYVNNLTGVASQASYRA